MHRDVGEEGGGFISQGRCEQHRVIPAVLFKKRRAPTML